MPVQCLDDLAEDTTITADIVIVGGGACGLTLARSLSGCGIHVVVLESGGQSEDPEHEALNTVEMAQGCWQQAEVTTRDKFHRKLTSLWDGALQPYGVRCRGLGGATQAWAGKSAPFDAIDYAPRDWVPLSGWPVTQQELEPYITRASDLLNLGPALYDEAFWTSIRRPPPAPSLNGPVLRTMFWQFARSRRTSTDIMRFGADFLASPPDDLDVYTHATVTKILSTPDGRSCTGVEAKSLSGRCLQVHTSVCVLAASAIENARLLLLSRDSDPAGLGNAHGCVGRYLMDHPTTTIARAHPDQISELAARFGLFSLRDDRRTYVYMHGLALSESFQRDTKGLNGAVFITEERASDDPFAALRRLLRKRSEKPLDDVVSVARSPLRLARGVAARVLERGYLPPSATRVIVDTALRLFPNTVAQDYQVGKLPLKLSGLRFDATTEQVPNPENRVMLSKNLDALGLPQAKVSWSPGAEARGNLQRIGSALADSFTAAGMAPLVVENWVTDKDSDAATVIDLGHSLGTTRMSAMPETGVVDKNCAVHNVDGLFIAGGSVLPTSGHANPTLMMLALTLRLGDTLRLRFGKSLDGTV
jgi:choline dehydrogenase-like flavoprotein